MLLESGSSNILASNSLIAFVNFSIRFSLSSMVIFLLIVFELLVSALVSLLISQTT
nr:MAG TPA: hypothetical protein [Caudoviricetes sp.]